MSPAHPSCAETKLRVQEKLFSQVFLIEANALQLCAITFLFGMKMVKKEKAFLCWLSQHRRERQREVQRGGEEKWRERKRRREKERMKEREKKRVKEKVRKKETESKSFYLSWRKL